MKVYRQLCANNQLVIPAQCAREFAKNRSKKLAELTKYLRNQASQEGPSLSKKIGALHGDRDYESLITEVIELSKSIKKISGKINSLAERISSDLGEDPVSIEYRKVFGGVVVDDIAYCGDQSEFQEDLKARYSRRRPPGYKDKGKDDSGAGDLLIWKCLLGEGSRRNQHCIFVTADEKGDWYVQSDGPFQPRLELIEEYRAETKCSLYIIPLSQLLKLYDANKQSVDRVRDAENARRKKLGRDSPRFSTTMHREERLMLLEKRALIAQRLEKVEKDLTNYPPYEANLNLPWDRVQKSMLDERARLASDLRFANQQLNQMRLFSDEFPDRD